MGNERMGEYEDAGREAQNKNFGRFFYVNHDELERMGVTQYRPEDGANFIAIIPPKDKFAMWCREVFVHSRIGVNNLTFLCMKEMRDHKKGSNGEKKVWNEPCSICEKRQQIYSKNPQSERLADLRAKKRYLMFVVDASQIKKGASLADMEKADLDVQWFNAPTSVRDGIVAATQDERTGKYTIDVSDPDHGANVVFRRVKKTGSQYATYESFKLEDRTPIPNAWLDCPDFDKVLKYTDYETIKAEVDGIPIDDPAGSGGGGRERGGDAGGGRERGGSVSDNSGSGGRSERSDRGGGESRTSRGGDSESVNEDSGSGQKSERSDRGGGETDSRGRSEEPSGGRSEEPSRGRSEEPSGGPQDKPSGGRSEEPSRGRSEEPSRGRSEEPEGEGDKIADIRSRIKEGKRGE